MTYKENVDDIRESPTFQLLNCMREHLASGIKVYDPMIKHKIIAEQIMDFDKFLKSVKMIVIMVAHKEIIKNSDRLQGKIVFDTRNAIKNDGVYKL